MSRADRLMDLADLLRGRDETTVAGLAGELGVTPRTLYRDLAALRDRGLPITGEPGRGGGIRLEGSRIDNLPPEEMRKIRGRVMRG